MCAPAATALPVRVGDVPTKPTERRRIGRPSVFTAAVRARILKAVAQTGTLEDAALVAGVSRATFHRWRQLGREQETGEFRDFLDAYEAVLARRRLKWERLILKHGETDWRALAKAMEWSDPQRYAPRVRVHVEEELSAAVQRLVEAFADDPDGLERALTALVGDRDLADLHEADDDDQPPDRGVTPSR